jgi:hypothetical protein
MVAKLPYLHVCNQHLVVSGGCSCPTHAHPPIHDKNPALIRLQSVKPLEKTKREKIELRNA